MCVCRKDLRDLGVGEGRGRRGSCEKAGVAEDCVLGGMSKGGSDGSDEDSTTWFEDGKPDELYDPDDDDATEKWVRENLVRRQRRRRRGESRGDDVENEGEGGGSGRQEEREEGQEALEEEEPDVGDREFHLTCPCCFTLLCVQSQQHVKYRNQFRAMFVMNCRTDEDHKLRVRVSDGTEKKGYGQKKAQRRDSDQYWPVTCSACGTNVGVLDAEEVYHFCNVLY